MKTHIRSPKTINRYLITILIAGMLLIAAVSGCSVFDTDNDDTKQTPAKTSPTTPLTAEPTTESTTKVRPTPEPTVEPTPEQLPPDSDNPMIALTFDDGPSLRDTVTLLDVLAAENVKATFFVLGGQVEIGRADLVKRAWQEGHEIANHTHSHVNLANAGKEQIREELAATNDLIEQITGEKPALMRPPQGSYNEEVKTISGELGLSVIIWDWKSCPEDWNHHDNPDHIARHVIDNAQNGHIVLLHDTNQATVAAMPKMIEGLKSRGFSFATVSELLSWQGEGQPEAGEVYSTYTPPAG